MIQYFFSFDRSKHHVLVEIHLKKASQGKLKLHLPAWRPGRYQLQNFSKNILNFKAFSNSEELIWDKVNSNTWEVESDFKEDVVITYTYYANELNAGSSLVNQEMIYINPINLCLFADINSPFEVFIHTAEHVKVASGLKHAVENSEITFFPSDYHEFFDSPFILSKNLQQFNFESSGVEFHLWIQGIYTLNMEAFMEDLKRVTEYQIQLFGGFPEKDYHFLLIVPYQSYYHGVEHRNSTVMVLGEHGILPPNYYQDLLGLASHELFHTWNIAKIRPVELLPYDYTRENYFKTCFVAEGYTTYFGDRTLFDSGVFTAEQYRHELETTFKRHFEGSDSACQSLLESSFDLWVDGYEKGIPDKKVSVYHKGAIATLILDVLIRKKSAGKKSMEDVMRKLFKEFGDLTKGYTYTDIVRITEEIYEGDLSFFYSTVIESNTPVFELTVEAVSHFDMELTKHEGSIYLNFH